MPGLTLRRFSEVSFTSLLVSTSSLCLSYIRPESKSVSPFSRIPPELLGEIILYILLSPGPRTLPSGSYTPVVSTDNYTTPFPFSNVNRHWRYIINSNPLLWRSIAFISPHPKHSYRTEVWLQRSKSILLDITIIETKDGGLAEREGTQSILNVLTPHAARWGRVQLQLEKDIPPAVVSAFLDIEVLPKPVLESVNFAVEPDEVTNAATAFDASSVYSGLVHTSSLLRLIWKTPFKTPNVFFSAKLLFLELHSPISITELSDSIVNCPNLLLLYATHVEGSPDPDTTPSESVIWLPRLVALCLNMVIPNSGGHRSDTLSLVPFLSRLSAPSLAHLQLRGIIDHTTGTAPNGALGTINRAKNTTRRVVQELLQRSHCPLESLNVNIPDAFAVEVQAWIDTPGTEDVSILCLSGCEVDDKVLEMLTWSHAPSETSVKGNRFPNLQHLGLSNCALSIDDDVLLRMLGSRFWTPIIPSRPSASQVVGTTSKTNKWKAMKELHSAHIWVRDLTTNMTSYQRMMNLCAERISEWKDEDRELVFTLA